jgi:hypothetical protein
VNFNLDHHQKVRHEGALYVVVIAEFPEFYEANDGYQVVIHPINNVNWITHNTNQAIRQQFTVSKNKLQLVNPGVME